MNCRYAAASFPLCTGVGWVVELSRVLYTTNGITPARCNAIQDTSSSYLQDTSQVLACVQARRPHTLLLSSCSEAWFSLPEHIWTAVWSQAGICTTIYCRLNLAAINRLSCPTTSEPHQMPSRHLICSQRCRLYHLVCCHCVAVLFYCFKQVYSMTFFLSPVDHCIMHRASSRTP